MLPSGLWDQNSGNCTSPGASPAVQNTTAGAGSGSVTGSITAALAVGAGLPHPTPTTAISCTPSVFDPLTYTCTAAWTNANACLTFNQPPLPKARPMKRLITRTVSYVPTVAFIWALVVCLSAPTWLNVLGPSITCGVSLAALICFVLSLWPGLPDTVRSSGGNRR
jgi:hypothetical protein